MPTHRSLSAWIEVDGEKLTEYDGEQDREDLRLYTCWIKSKIGDVSL